MAIPRSDERNDLADTKIESGVDTNGGGVDGGLGAIFDLSLKKFESGTGGNHMFSKKDAFSMIPCVLPVVLVRRSLKWLLGSNDDVDDRKIHR